MFVYTFFVLFLNVGLKKWLSRQEVFLARVKICVCMAAHGGPGRWQKKARCGHMYAVGANRPLGPPGLAPGSVRDPVKGIRQSAGAGQVSPPPRLCATHTGSTSETQRERNWPRLSDITWGGRLRSSSASSQGSSACGLHAPLSSVGAGRPYEAVWTDYRHGLLESCWTDMWCVPLSLTQNIGFAFNSIS